MKHLGAGVIIRRPTYTPFDSVDEVQEPVAAQQIRGRDSGLF